ncbi:MAG TPA: thioredoxin domain-containing protein [Candidatus Paceibacterota bacterium]|jgi:protein-disulfide isomerase|nr:thioredoxin domain-containing protein [Candidatus Paceibacterota bacterium]
MENNTNKEQKISTPMAIIVAGFLIMIGILLVNNNKKEAVPKTLSEQVGVSKDDLNACIKGTDLDALNNKINTSIDNATKGLKDSERGTPYTIIIGKNGVKTEINGASSYDNVKQIIDDALAGKTDKKYTGNVALSEPNDHILGNENADITMIEYSDFECPFCKQFQPVLEKIMVDYSPHVRWIYRHWPLHQHSFEKLVAAECVAKLKGNTAFWKYADLLFGMMDTPQDSVSAQL